METWRGMRWETVNRMHSFNTRCRESPSKQGLAGEWSQRRISDGHEIFRRERMFYWRLSCLPPLPTAPPVSVSWLSLGLNFVHRLPYETFPKCV